MNRLILDNPFDQELQSITTQFGALLRSIVVTIDEHGLERKHLKSHIKPAAAFFDALAERVYESDATKSLQERLLRNRGASSLSCNMMACRGTTIWPRTRSSA